MRSVDTKFASHRRLHATAAFVRGALVLAALVVGSIATAATDSTEKKAAQSASDDSSQEFRTVLQKRGDTAVLVKYVMSFSGASSEQQQDGQTQGTLVSPDGLILVPGRVVSFDISQITGAAIGSANSPVVKSGHFRVQMPGSEEWQPADLVTRDTELGLAWLRLRRRTQLPFVDFNDTAKVGVGSSLFFVMRTSDQLGSVPIVRGGYVLGETKVPRTMLLIDGTPGLAFDGEGKPAGFADVDFGSIARSQAGGIGMNYGDSVFKMIPAERIGRVTAQAAKLPVVPPDADDSDSPLESTPPPPASNTLSPVSPVSPDDDANAGDLSSLPPQPTPATTQNPATPPNK